MEQEKIIDGISRAGEEIQDKSQIHITDQVVSTIYQATEDILTKSINKEKNNRNWGNRIDDIITSKIFAFPIMIVLLGVIFWISLQGAEHPSAMLLKLFSTIEVHLSNLFLFLRAPFWLHGALVLGVYKTVSWVIAVMFPPMAIFFPLFTFFEDLGYLPRVAFNLDKFYKMAGAHGKQSLTMAMGFGCNAVGVMACRIIDSPREKLIAILTNTFMPCNGRFPLLFTLAILLASGFTGVGHNPLFPSIIVVGMVLLGIAMTFLTSFLLSRTILKGKSSSFTLELPPYRRPHIGQILVRSFLDRTLFVLSRAVIVAAPAGLVTYILANVYVGGSNLITHFALYLEPFGRLIGLDGYIILAFIIALPANEIVIPVLMMSYLSLGVMADVSSIGVLGDLFVANGWSIITIINTMIFSLLHFPCGTTLLTIQKEAGKGWAILGAVLPTLVAVLVCFIITRLAILLNIF